MCVAELFPINNPDKRTDFREAGKIKQINVTRALEGGKLIFPL